MRRIGPSLCTTRNSQLRSFPFPDNGHRHSYSITRSAHSNADFLRHVANSKRPSRLEEANARHESAEALNITSQERTVESVTRFWWSS